VLLVCRAAGVPGEESTVNAPELQHLLLVPANPTNCTSSARLSRRIVAAAETAPAGASLSSGGYAKIGAMLPAGQEMPVSYPEADFDHPSCGFTSPAGEGDGTGLPRDEARGDRPLAG